MRVAFFSSKAYDIEYFNEANKLYSFELIFHEARLTETTVEMCSGAEAICVFVNDHLNKTVLQQLHNQGVSLIAMRCAGYNNLDLEAAKNLGMQVVRVPQYSPAAVAEHVLALLLTLYRSTHKAYSRVREGNFSLVGLTGHEVGKKTVGIIGTGAIGKKTAEIFCGFGCRVLGYDVAPDTSWATQHNLEYVALERVYAEADIISLHCPLNKETRHLVNAKTLAKMRKGVTIINTGRGALLDTNAVYNALKSRQVGYLAIDVYEEEANLFFEDLSTDIIMDDLFMRLTTFPNVLITGHQGFFTDHALRNIADSTLNNLDRVTKELDCTNQLV